LLALFAAGNHHQTAFSRIDFAKRNLSGKRLSGYLFQALAIGHHRTVLGGDASRTFLKKKHPQKKTCA
jgi:hypothetical protein